MSTFRPATSSLANFNDTLSMISMIQLSSTLAVLIKTRTDVCHGITAHTLWGITQWTPSQHREPTPGSLNSVQWRFQDINFSPSTFIASEFQQYNHEQYQRSLRLDSSVMYTCYQKGIVVLGCGQFWPSLLSACFVLSAYFLAVLETSVCAY